jgi:hypothetical protein
MRPKYVLHDGQRHFIGAGQLCQVYGVRMKTFEKCECGFSLDTKTTATTVRVLESKDPAIPSGSLAQLRLSPQLMETLKKLATRKGNANE